MSSPAGHEGHAAAVAGQRGPFQPNTFRPSRGCQKSSRRPSRPCWMPLPSDRAEQVGQVGDDREHLAGGETGGQPMRHGEPDGTAGRTGEDILDGHVAGTDFGNKDDTGSSGLVPQGGTQQIRDCPQDELAPSHNAGARVFLQLVDDDRALVICQVVRRPAENVAGWSGRSSAGARNGRREPGNLWLASYECSRFRSLIRQHRVPAASLAAVSGPVERITAPALGRAPAFVLGVGQANELEHTMESEGHHDGEGADRIAVIRRERPDS